MSNPASMDIEEKLQTGKDKKAAADELFRKGDHKGGGYAASLV